MVIGTCIFTKALSRSFPTKAEEGFTCPTPPGIKLIFQEGYWNVKIIVIIIIIIILDRK